MNSKNHKYHKLLSELILTILATSLPFPIKDDIKLISNLTKERDLINFMRTLEENSHPLWVLGKHSLGFCRKENQA